MFQQSNSIRQVFFILNAFFLPLACEALLFSVHDFYSMHSLIRFYTRSSRFQFIFYCTLFSSHFVLWNIIPDPVLQRSLYPANNAAVTGGLSTSLPFSYRSVGCRYLLFSRVLLVSNIAQWSISIDLAEHPSTCRTLG